MINQSLMDLIKLYGDACGDRDGDGLAPVELAAIEERLLEIKSALGNGREANQLVGDVHKGESE